MHVSGNCRTDLTVYGFIDQTNKTKYLIPISIKNICCDYVGYYECCILQKQCQSSIKSLRSYKTLFNSTTNPKHSDQKNDENEIWDEEIDHYYIESPSLFRMDYKQQINPINAFFIASQVDHTGCMQQIFNLPSNVYDENNDENNKLLTYHKDNMDCTPLFIACQNDNIHTVRLLLSFINNNDAKIKYINTLNHDQSTALMASCVSDSSEITKLILSISTECINTQRESDGSTALFIACREGHLRCVQSLMQCATLSTDICKHNGRSSLFIASFFGHYDIVKALIEFNCDVNIGDNKGFTSLFVASQNGHNSIVKLLLNNGAQIDQAEQRGHTPLWIASLRGHVDVVRTLILHLIQKNRDPQGLDNDFNIVLSLDSPDLSGVTPLWAACQANNHECVEMLLNPRMLISDFDSQNDYEMQGAQIDLAKFDGCVPLWIAASRGNIECVELLIKYKGDINIPDKSQGATPVFVACQNGHLSVVKSLLNANADINKARFADGTTPIMIAAHNGHLDIVSMLLSKDKLDIRQLSQTGLSVFGCAVMQGHLILTKLLHKHLLDIVFKGNETEFVKFVDTGDFENGWTPFHLACQHGHIDVIQYLIDQVGIDIHKLDNDGINGLNHALQNDHRVAVECLLKSEKEKKKKMDVVNQKDPSGFSPLFVAAYHGRSEIMLVLLQNNADVNVIDESTGCTPLWISCSQGHLECVKILLSQPETMINIDHQDQNGITALLIATEKNNFEIAQILLDPNNIEFDDQNSSQFYDDDDDSKQHLTKHSKSVAMVGANVNVAESSGLTPMRVACALGHLEMVKLLLRYDADIEIHDATEGANALFVACQNGYQEIVELLLAKGSDIRSQRKKDATTPMMIAAHNGHLNIIQLLVAFVGKRNSLDLFLSNNTNNLNIFGCSSMNGHRDIIEYIYELIVSVSCDEPIDIVSMLNQRTISDGYTCFSISCMQGHLDIVQYLVQLGADMFIQDNEGKTGLELAWTHGFQEIVYWLSDIQQ